MQRKSFFVFYGKLGKKLKQDYFKNNGLIPHTRNNIINFFLKNQGYGKIVVFIDINCDGYEDIIKQFEALPHDIYNLYQKSLPDIYGYKKLNGYYVNFSQTEEVKKIINSF